MQTIAQNPQQILQVLNLTYLQYDNFRESIFQEYCKALSRQFFIGYRHLNSNDYLRNYFHDMWNVHVEDAFLRENAEFIPLCEIKLMRELFENYTRNLIDNQAEMYPVVLIREIRKELKYKEECN